MSNDKVVSPAAPAPVSDPLTDLLRSGARRLIEAAVTAEFEEYLGPFEEQKLANGRRRVVRNGHLPERQILTRIGAVSVPESSGIPAAACLDCDGHTPPFSPERTASGALNVRYPFGGEWLGSWSSSCSRSSTPT